MPYVGYAPAMKKTTLYLPEELHRDAHVKAAQLGISLTDAVRKLLRWWLAQPDPARRKRAG